MHAIEWIDVHVLVIVWIVIGVVLLRDQLRNDR